MSRILGPNQAGANGNMIDAATEKASMEISDAIMNQEEEVNVESN